MPMNPNFLCCIGAELKNSTQQTTRMSQVYLYRAFEDDTLSDMLSAGFFNAAMGIIRKDDLLLLYSPNETTAKYTYARVSNVSSSGVVIEQIGIDATQIIVNTTGYSNLSGDNLQEIMNNLDTLLTTMNDAFVRKDGTSIMTGPLKFVAGSLRGGIGPTFGGVEFYTLNNDSPTYSLVTLGRFSTNGFLPHNDNTYDIGSTARKWKDLYVARVIAGVLNNGADISVPTTAGTMALTSDIKNSTVSVQLDGSAVDSFTLNQSSNKTINIPAANKNLSNLTSTGQNIANWSSNVTNCITKIPQDINLTLSNGTLTLKAGSKAYIPNGSGVFDTLTINSDISFGDSSTPVGGNNVQIFIACRNGEMTSRPISSCESGAGATAVGGFAYNTTTNKIGFYGSGGTLQSSGWSFPIAIVSTNGSGIASSIDQVFNGFGYIGSSVFALPGLSGLVPNGRNADGTLKNTAWTTTQVIVRTFTNGGNYALFFDGNVFARTNSHSYLYKEQENLNWDTAGDQIFTVTYLSLISMNSSGRITYMGNHNVFHSVDYDDSDWAAHQAMPSNKYVDLTLGVSGTSYTAPNDGYFTVAKTSGDANAYLSIDVVSGSERIINQFVETSSATRSLALSVPVSKGNTVYVYYSATGTTNKFRFVYANGSK